MRTRQGLCWLGLLMWIFDARVMPAGSVCSCEVAGDAGRRRHGGSFRDPRIDGGGWRAGRVVRKQGVQTIVLFDIDGTLLSAGGADRRALLRAFRELWDLDAAVDGLRVHGRTDPEIMGEIFRSRLGRPPDARECQLLYKSYLAYLEEELITSPGFQILPGVARLLETLSGKPHIALGLATGNLERAATLKLRRAALLERFRFGAYGSDAADREALVRLAIDRGKALLACRTCPVGVIVVGDTALDVAAGKRLEISTVAVATGGDSFDTLADANPDYLLPDLSDPTVFLTILEEVRERRAVPERGVCD